MPSGILPRHSRAAAFALLALALLSGCSSGHHSGTYSGSSDEGQGTLVIAADNSPESRVVGQLYARLLTAAGKSVTLAADVATPGESTAAVFSGRIALAPAYVSTLLRTTRATQSVPGDITDTLSMALPVGIDALPPAAAQRGVVFAVSQATAQRYGLHSLADLAKANHRLVLGDSLGSDPDMPSLATLETAYGVTFASVRASDTADVLALRSTDPRIAQGGWVVLTDPDGVVPAENVFPLISSPYADKATTTALARLNTKLTTEQLATLTAEVNGGETPATAAQQWLKAEKLLS